MSALLKKENICKALQKFYTKQMEIPNGLHTFLAVNCVINAILSFTAIVLNIITIQALKKTSSLSKTFETLLLSLAISDVGVDLVVQSHDTFSTIYVAMEGGKVSSCLIRLRIKVREIITWLTFLNITKKTEETGVNMT